MLMYNSYAVSVKMSGGGPGYKRTDKRTDGKHASDRDNMVAAASLVICTISHAVVKQVILSLSLYWYLCFVENVNIYTN